MYPMPQNLAPNVNLLYCTDWWTLGSKRQKNSCWTFLSPSSIEDGGYSSQWENFVSVRHTFLRCLPLGNCWRDSYETCFV